MASVLEGYSSLMMYASTRQRFSTSCDLCRHWKAKGSCRLGDACNFLHSKEVPSAGYSGSPVPAESKKKQVKPPPPSAVEEPEELDPASRFLTLTTQCAARLSSRLLSAGKCERCALTRKECICEKLSDLRTTLHGDGGGGGGGEGRGNGLLQRLRWAVWMHVRERGRASNTGKILGHLLPNCEVFLHGVDGELERFRKAVECVGANRSFILFPSSDAIPAREGMVRAFETSTEPCLIAVLDGTWRQARHMQREREFHGLTRIALTECGRSEFHWRRQSQEGRISTVEAGAYLLEELLKFGQADSDDGEAPSSLRKGLSYLNAALERQSHCDGLKEPLVDEKGDRHAHRMPKQPLGLRGMPKDEGDAET